MLAILGGIGAALAWTATTLAASRATRHVDSRSLLATVMTVGLVISIPPALLAHTPTIHTSDALWLVVAGCANVGGLLLTYSALRVGKVGVVAPITSTEGAIAAVIAVIAGQHLSTGTVGCLVVITGGIVLAARAPGGDRAVHARSVVLAGLAAFAFGLGLYSGGRVGQSLGIAWALLPARVVGVVVIALPLLVSRRWRMTRKAMPFAVVGGVCEVLGFAAYVFGARHNLAIAAVLGSQFAGLSVVVGWLLFRERLTRVQVAGVVGIIVGVSALSAIHS
ncbi:MAG TPA: DMT family transporter [Gaiellaceae bacterium]|nr:DMT family transporter [Gaiellaceae bacterium]